MGCLFSCHESSGVSYVKPITNNIACSGSNCDNIIENVSGYSLDTHWCYLCSYKCRNCGKQLTHDTRKWAPNAYASNKVPYCHLCYNIYLTAYNNSYDKSSAPKVPDCVGITPVCKKCGISCKKYISINTKWITYNGYCCDNCYYEMIR